MAGTQISCKLTHATLWKSMVIFSVFFVYLSRCFCTPAGFARKFPCVLRRTFLESPKNFSSPKSCVICKMFTNKYSVIVDFKKSALKSYVYYTNWTGLRAKTFNAI